MQVINLKQRPTLLNASGAKSRSIPSEYDDEFSFIPAGPADMNQMA